MSSQGPWRGSTPAGGHWERPPHCHSATSITRQPFARHGGDSRPAPLRLPLCRARECRGCRRRRHVGCVTDTPAEMCVRRPVWLGGCGEMGWGTGSPALVGPCRAAQSNAVGVDWGPDPLHQAGRLRCGKGLGGGAESRAVEPHGVGKEAKARKTYKCSLMNTDPAQHRLALLTTQKMQIRCKTATTRKRRLCQRWGFHAIIEKTLWKAWRREDLMGLENSHADAEWDQEGLLRPRSRAPEALGPLPSSELWPQ